MSISEGNMMEQGRNGIYLLQDNTSVDNLLGKWLKEDVKVESKSCSDEMMDVDTGNAAQEDKDDNPTSDHVDGRLDDKTLREPEVGAIEIWTQCTSFYEIFRAASGPEKMLGTQEKEPIFKARKRFENWFDIFLVRGLTMKEEDWETLMSNASASGVSMSDTIRGSVVEYLMKEVRNLCLHFEAYKDFDPLRTYLFGKGYRILRLLCRIESHSIKQNKDGDKNYSEAPMTSTSSLKDHFKTELNHDKKGTHDKEFLDLLLHLFEVRGFLKNLFNIRTLKLCHILLYYDTIFILVYSLFFIIIQSDLELITRIETQHGELSIVGGKLMKQKVIPIILVMTQRLKQGQVEVK